MSDWIDFERWSECVSIERPGVVFEVTNTDGQSLLTSCVIALPIPLDWTSPPVRFRTVPEPKLRHSSPMPLPLLR